VTFRLYEPSSLYVWLPNTSKPPLTLAWIVPWDVVVSPQDMVAEKSEMVPNGFASSKCAINVLFDKAAPSTADNGKEVAVNEASATTI